MADDDAGDRAGEEKRKIDKGVVGAQRGTAILDGNVADGFDGERRKDQRISNANQSRGDKRGRGNSRETQKEQAEDLNEERNEGNGKSADTRDQASKNDPSHDEARSIDRQREGSAA